MQAIHKHMTMTEIQAGLAAAGSSPQNHGTVELIVCRPATEQRRVLDSAEFHLTDGLIGDNWKARGSTRTDDGQAHPGMQVAIMNSRVIQVLTDGDQSRWSLAGDQLFIDLDISIDNLPVGQQLSIGTAILEISEIPHTGCAKFTARYGSEATQFVNSPDGRQMRGRGVNARVVKAGTICVGDTIAKIESES